MLDLHTLPDFDSAARAALTFLHGRVGLDLWMITRSAGEHWIVLHAEDRGYGVKQGQVFRWADSLCSQMVQDRGPRIAPRCAEIPAYASAPINNHVPIGAYVGVPLTRSDGTLFGTLCAIHPASVPESVAGELPLVELLARLLCSLLDAELRLAEQARRAERAQVEAMTDSLTGLYNRRGWDRLLTAEESRCRRYGHLASVVSLDLDQLKAVNDRHGHAAGDALLHRTGQALQAVTRRPDIVARVGGDEFAILGVETDGHGVAGFVRRLEQALKAAGIPASIGAASRDPQGDLGATWQAADEAMYAQKRGRKSVAPVFDGLPSGDDLCVTR